MRASTKRLGPGALVVALALTLTCARPSMADTDAAAKLFRSASGAFARHDYRAAAIDFEEAYRQAPHPATLFNAALAWDAANEPARAADAFAGALAQPGLDAQQTAQGRRKLDALEQQLGVIDASGPANATVTLEHVRRGRLPAAIHVAPGAHDVLFEGADGARKQASVRVAAGERQRARFDVDPPRATPPRRPIDKPAPSPPTSSSLPTLGWIAIGAGAVAFGVGVALGVKAMDARSDYEASGRRDLDAYDRATSLKTITTGLWIGAAAAGALGVTLLVAAPRKTPVAVVLGPAGVAASARF